MHGQGAMWAEQIHGGEYGFFIACDEIGIQVQLQASVNCTAREASCKQMEMDTSGAKAKHLVDDAASSSASSPGKETEKHEGLRHLSTELKRPTGLD